MCTKLQGGGSAMSSCKEQPDSACAGPGERAVEGELLWLELNGQFVARFGRPVHTASSLVLQVLTHLLPVPGRWCAGLLAAVGSTVGKVAEHIPGTAEHELRKTLDEEGDLSVDTGERLPRDAGERWSW